MFPIAVQLNKQKGFQLIGCLAPFLFWFSSGTLDKYCSSYTCPDDYALLNDADTIICDDGDCTKDQCRKHQSSSHTPKKPLMGVDVVFK